VQAAQSQETTHLLQRRVFDGCGFLGCDLERIQVRYDTFAETNEMFRTTLFPFFGSLFAARAVPLDCIPLVFPCTMSSTRKYDWGNRSALDVVVKKKPIEFNFVSTQSGDTSFGKQDLTWGARKTLRYTGWASGGSQKVTVGGLNRSLLVPSP
jgi:hypothetical protein